MERVGTPSTGPNLLCRASQWALFLALHMPAHAAPGWYAAAYVEKREKWPLQVHTPPTSLAPTLSPAHLQKRLRLLHTIQWVIGNLYDHAAELL